MKQYAQRYFLPYSILMLLSILCVAPARANPFFSPETPPEQSHDELDSESSNTEKADIDTEQSETQVLSVRISGANPDLIKTQGNLREKLGELFYNWNEAKVNGTSTASLLWTVLWVSFLYGIIHAAGPGHRKTIVFSLYLTRKAQWWEPTFTGIMLALLHGGTAVVIMLIFKGISGSIVANTTTLTIYMEGFSYLLLIGTALLLMIYEIIAFTRERHHHGVFHPKEKLRKKTSLVAFFIASLYPCPGAILILILAFTLNILDLGIISVFAMSFGMSLPIIGAAYFAWAGRTSLFTLLKQNEKAVAIITFCVEMAGYAILLAFSLYISWPFLISLCR